MDEENETYEEWFACQKAECDQWMALIALFIALNTAIWSRNIERIDNACYQIGQKGYMAYPVFVLFDRFPLWGMKRVDFY